ncbi:hypothetical protein EDC96DRAFT_509682 [Choanephora cucurbitarum]|nr:hypothetical protein EDC96DRAFT_509682 [Choanephora cucurbitarum]
MSSYKKKLPSTYTILVFLIVLLCSGIIVQFAILSPHRPSSAANTQPYTYQLDEEKIPEHKSPVHSPPPASLLTPPLPPKQVIPKACQGVDFKWLASDRKFWDGWSSKSMFMKPNGKFTRKTVRIQQGESICIAALLGPIPALSIIKAMSHYGPADSIMVTAVDRLSGIKIPIVLQQHDQQTNGYFASVEMAYVGQFELETSVEYRSYFWEYPNFHKYLPNRFTSENRLNVRPAGQSVQDKPCGPSGLAQSAWKKNRVVHQFLPRCQLTDCSRTFKTAHYWGDDHLRRNIEITLQPPSYNNECDAIEEIEFPLYDGNQTIYFNPLTDGLVQNLEAWKTMIQKQARQLPKADLVVLGIGNHDLGGIRQDPTEFAAHFYTFLTYLHKEIYPQQTIVVKTTQPIAGKLYAGYNYGRSEAYANIIKTSVRAINSSRVILWDIHQLGFVENQCTNQVHSRQSVIRLENRLFSHLLCQL